MIIQNIDESITQENLDQVLRDLAFECQTSMPDEIRMISALGTAYAVFPSKEAAKKILYVIFYPFFRVFKNNIFLKKDCELKNKNLIFFY